MTDTDAIIISACIIVLALYAAWLWDEAKNAIPYPNDAESQNKDAQTQESTSDETPTNETKTQQEARK